MSSLELALDQLFIREINVGDTAATVRLNEELGYPVSPEVMKQRIAGLTMLADHAIFVACISGEVVGWIEIREGHHLTVEARAEIGGLIVSSSMRSCGIGRRLVGRAEQWARERGLKNGIVRSRTGREGAHRFYLREGYAQTKTSVVFSKELK